VWIALASAIVAGVLAASAWLWRIDVAILDAWLAHFQRPAPADIVIVAVDEQSLQSVGAWPWPRRLHADLVQRLSGAGAKVIGFDVVFAEADRLDAEGDALFARAVADSRRVVLPVSFEQLRQGGQPIEVFPFQALAVAATALGHVDFAIDADGRTRALFLRAGIGDAFWPSLTLAMLAVAQEWTNAEEETVAPPVVERNPFAWVRRDRVIVPLAGPAGHFRHVSYGDVAAGQVDPQVFAGALVLVGVTASTVGGRFQVAPAGHNPVMSAVEFNANTLDALRRGLVVHGLGLSDRVALTAVLVVLAAGLFALPLPAVAVLAAGLVTIAGVDAALLYGAWHWFEPTAALLGVLVAFGAHLCRRRRLQRIALSAERQRVQATWGTISDGVMVLDRDGAIEEMNPAAQRLTGWPIALARGRPVDAVLQLADEEHKAAVAASGLVVEVARGEPCLARPMQLRSLAGEERAVQLSVAGYSGDGAAGAVLTFADVTDLRRLVHVVAEQAGRDELTALPNRKVFSQHLAQAIARARVSRQALAVLVLDLDGFKRFNDVFGYSAGDALLNAVAVRLNTSRRRGDSLARLGADEFAVLFENLAAEETALFLAHQLRRSLAAPFVIQGFQVGMTVSVGIAVFPGDGRTGEAILDGAGYAVQRAKQRGGNCIERYAGLSDVVDLARAKSAMPLQNAIDNNALSLLYQPVVDLRTGTTVAVEALLRWRQADGREMLPGEFIPYCDDAETNGALAGWVLRSACHQLRAWRRQGWRDVCVGVNLSANQLLVPDLTTTVMQILEETGIDGRALCLDVTETALMTECARTAETLRQLRAAGVAIAIDDFGVGYSSLTLLKKLPIETVKLDRTFLQDALSNTGDAGLVTAVVVMAHAMNLKVVAEGIETDAQLQFARAQRIDQAQGYLIGPPVEAVKLSSQFPAKLIYK
jgi:diguanylate cyclase (GGDEF)-like protein/PAS domain S-box-containing protein